MEKVERLLERVEASKSFVQLKKAYKTEGVTVHLEEMVGGALSLYAATLIRKVGGVHLFVAEDRDAAAYMLNDFYALLDESRVLFFPTSYKKSILYHREDAQGVVQRTAVLNALRSHRKGYLVICTYPEALAERVADEGSLSQRMLSLRVGQTIAIASLQEQLEALCRWTSSMSQGSSHVVEVSSTSSPMPRVVPIVSISLAMR